MKNISEKSNKILGLEYMNSLGFRVPKFSFLLDFSSLGLNLEDLNVDNPPSILKKRIRNIMRELNIQNGLSVRSASFDEDNASQSSAGRYLSFNGLETEEEVITSAIKIWQHHRKNSNNVLCPLIIQETHPSFFSGVAFKDRDTIIIEAYFGACSNLVEGCVVPYYTMVKGGEVSHRYGSNCCCNKYSVHSSVFRNGLLVSGTLLTPKMEEYTNNTRFYNSKNSKIINVYGNRPLMTISHYESKIFPYIVDVLNKLDNGNGVDIEWGSDIEGNVYLYQYRTLTRNITDLYSAVQQEEKIHNIGNGIKGIPTSRGKVTGKVVYQNSIDCENAILLLEYDNLEDVSILKNIKGIISLYGGVLSHLSIICRELEIPCIVGINAKIPAGTEIELDGDLGLIKILE